MIKNGWYCCPNCGWGKVQVIEPTSTTKGLPIYCKKCKRTSYPTIINGIEVPDAKEKTE